MSMQAVKSFCEHFRLNANTVRRLEVLIQQGKVEYRKDRWSDEYMFFSTDHRVRGPIGIADNERKDWEYKYLGMSYEMLSRRASTLLDEATRTGNWHAIVEDLAAIRSEMNIRRAMDYAVL